MLLPTPGLMQVPVYSRARPSHNHNLIYMPEILREVAAETLPIRPLVLRMPVGSLPRRFSLLRLGLPRILLRVDPLPDLTVPGVLGRDAELMPMFSMSLLLSWSIEEV